MQGRSAVSCSRIQAMCQQSLLSVTPSSLVSLKHSHSTIEVLSLIGDSVASFFTHTEERKLLIEILQRSERDEAWPTA